MAATHKVIVLSRAVAGAWETFSCLFWFDITTGLKTQTSGSQWPQATATDNSAVQSGAVLEEPQSFNFPAGLANGSPSAVEAYMNQAWANRNAEINGIGPGEFNNITESPTGVWG